MAARSRRKSPHHAAGACVTKHRLFIVVPVSLVMASAVALGGEMMVVSADVGQRAAQTCHARHPGRAALERRFAGVPRPPIAVIPPAPAESVAPQRVTPRPAVLHVSTSSPRPAPSVVAPRRVTLTATRHHVAPPGAAAQRSQRSAVRSPADAPTPPVVAPPFPALLPAPVPAISQFRPSMLLADLAVAITVSIAAAAALSAALLSRRTR
jgi:hypothetical protein